MILINKVEAVRLFLDTIRYIADRIEKKRDMLKNQQRRESLVEIGV